MMNRIMRAAFAASCLVAGSATWAAAAPLCFDHAEARVGAAIAHKFDVMKRLPQNRAILIAKRDEACAEVSLFMAHIRDELTYGNLSGYSVDTVIAAYIRDVIIRAAVYNAAAKEPRTVGELIAALGLTKRL